ncbi:MAG TPA: DUF885 domain-containing protein [Vicinamibacteria bacterium]|nr:DUF885 domain-containing protein [Vicinamibacteria bacterium]
MDLHAEARAIVDSRGREPEGRRLHRLFEACWRYSLAEYPELATYVGERGQSHRWTDLSPEAIERRRAELEIPARVLATIDRARLAPADQDHLDLFARATDEALEGRRFPSERMPLNQMQGVQQSVAQMLAMMPAASVADFEDMLARLQAVPALIDQTIALLREGAARGLTPPRITLRDVPQQVLNQITDDPLAAPAVRPFQRLPEAIPEAQRSRLRDAAARVYGREVAPAWRRLHACVADEYLPRAREAIAMSALPDGEAWYAFNVRQSTTTRLSPREIHDVGLGEVARIREEMERVRAATGFTGSFAAFADFLRTDPRFFFERAEDLLVAYRDIAKRADPELARLFGRLPRLPYGVLPVPSYAERSQTTAYYEPGSPAAGRPGYFYANTYDLRSRPRWEMEALTLHEAVPGHHLQIALAQEMEDVPEFRRHGFYTAYVEGWGLYAEGLGTEMGFYKDPHSRFGQLTYEVWRAIRLVVDTGMHALGWPRDQAIRYFEENAGKAEHDIVVEIDRYIVWPGQALAYKIGELKIKELRAWAAAELGPRFDLRSFHDQVLGGGAMPLDLLETKVRRWVQEGLSSGDDHAERRGPRGVSASSSESTT